MHCLKKIRVFFLILLLTSYSLSFGEGINPLYVKGYFDHNNHLLITTRYQINLSTQLEEAIHQGVALNFDFRYDFVPSSLYNYKLKLNQLLGLNTSLTYRLSYHPLTNQYRVSIGTLSSNFPNLNSALQAIGRVSNYNISGRGLLSSEQRKNNIAVVKLALSTGKLPKPFQINALNSKSWNLDTGWVELQILNP